MNCPPPQLAPMTPLLALASPSSAAAHLVPDELRAEAMLTFAAARWEKVAAGLPSATGKGTLCLWSVHTVSVFSSLLLSSGFRWSVWWDWQIQCTLLSLEARSAEEVSRKKTSPIAKVTYMESFRIKQQRSERIWSNTRYKTFCIVFLKNGFLWISY